MGDVFLEQIIKKKSTMKDNFIKALILLGAILVFLFAFRFVWIPEFGVGSFAFLIAVGVLVFAWYVITGLNLEFEYIYTNGELDIDKISAKRKRKRMLTVKINSFETFGKYDHQKLKTEKFNKVFHACTQPLDESVYYAIFHGKEGQRCLLTISPNEKLLAEIEKQTKRRIR